MIVDRFETHAMAIYRPYQLLAKIPQVFAAHPAIRPESLEVARTASPP
jgi:hypothetical protein